MGTSLSSKLGFTLVEVMVAMMITLFVLLGLLKAVEIATEQNLRNNVRDEMVQVAEERLNRFRSTPFAMISTCTTCSGGLRTYAAESVPSQLRSFNVRYTVVRSTVVTSDGSAANLGVNVSWLYKGTTYSHEMHTVKTQ